ncbi:hypothetical protein TSUD_179600 [Trifolium subterraneum]|uniref:Uncharacterized protein n=1 Tax=Trifolium subterraneum TaxID=3900 RepID=A0A1B5Z7D2_TRISU|nr:hypothetical protein TSUD_414620 [Trifolium subterraneum]GAU43865.1 hypothetical protein TSUD_179600 [Trifolium subterraneum]
MASNLHRNGAQRGSAKFDRPLKPRPRASSPSPGSGFRRPNSAVRNDAELGDEDVIVIAKFSH